MRVALSHALLGLICLQLFRTGTVLPPAEGLGGQWFRVRTSAEAEAAHPIPLPARRGPSPGSVDLALGTALRLATVTSLG